MANNKHGATGSWTHGLLGPIDTIRAAMNTIGSYNRPHEAYYWGVGDAPWFEAFLPYLTPDLPVAGPAGLEGFARQYDELPASLVEKYLASNKHPPASVSSSAASKALGLLGGPAFTVPLMGQFLNAKDVLPASLTKKYLDRW